MPNLLHDAQQARYGKLVKKISSNLAPKNFVKSGAKKNFVKFSAKNFVKFGAQKQKLFCGEVDDAQIKKKLREKIKLVVQYNFFKKISKTNDLLLLETHSLPSLILLFNCVKLRIKRNNPFFACEKKSNFKDKLPKNELNEDPTTERPRGGPKKPIIPTKMK